MHGHYPAHVRAEKSWELGQFHAELESSRDADGKLRYFDMSFLDMEFKRSGLQALSEVCEVTDTLAMAKSKHPGQKNSLDALVRRYEIPQRDRTFHGALLDAEILADVYLAMTGGQVLLDIDALSSNQNNMELQGERRNIDVSLSVITPSTEELEAHENWIKEFQEKQHEPCLFAK